MGYHCAHLIQSVCFALPLLALACGGDERPEAAAPLTGDLTRFDLVIENSGSRALERAEVWVDAPRAASADWRRTGIEVSHPYSIEPRAHGDERIRLAFEDVPVGFRERISVRASLEPDGEDAAAPHANPAAHAAAVAGFDAASLREQAQALVGADAGATVGNVIAWVGTRAPGELPQRAVPPPDAFGDVDEAALAEGGPRGPDGELLAEAVPLPQDDVWLAVALLRAADVPARVVAGFADSGDGALRAERFELWLEVHLEGRWQTRRFGEPEEGRRVVAMRIVEEPSDLVFGPAAKSLAESNGLRVSFQ